MKKDRINNEEFKNLLNYYSNYFDDKKIKNKIYKIFVGTEDFLAKYYVLKKFEYQYVIKLPLRKKDILHMHLKELKEEELVTILKTLEDKVIKLDDGDGEKKLNDPYYKLLLSMCLEYKKKQEGKYPHILDNCKIKKKKLNIKM